MEVHGKIFYELRMCESEKENHSWIRVLGQGYSVGKNII